MTIAQQFLTIAIPFGDGSEWCDIGDVERVIAELGNPARADIAEALRATGVIQFAHGRSRSVRRTRFSFFRKSLNDSSCFSRATRSCA